MNRWSVLARLPLARLPPAGQDRLAAGTSDLSHSPPEVPPVYDESMPADPFAPSSIDGDARGRVLQDIANEMVRLFKEQFGRGPTRARAHWSADDVVSVTLEDTFTPAERNLARMGEHQRLRDMRARSSSTRRCASSASRSSG